MLGLPVLGRYFRAHLAVAEAPASSIPSGYAISNFDPDRDLEAASRLMNAAYPSLRQLMTPEKLRRMAEAPHYDPRQWFFLIETSSSQPVGFAIHGYCDELREGFIDWIEVLPRLRHRGFGSLLTHECIRRLADRASFITTQGSLDAPFVHGDLYKKCGFERIRQWTILGQGRIPEERADIFTVPPGHPGY
jgi:ribosomal protein S18 acetylase RimI-like enzyme